MKKLLPLIAFFSGMLYTVSAQTTYKDVAPIFYANCTTCHNPGGIAPVSYMNYTQTALWTPTIKAFLNSNTMPPWPPDTTYCRFFDEKIITLAEKTKIINWIDSGSMKGDTTLAPPAPIYTNSYKLHGTPDLIVKIPTFTSNATSTQDAYDCFALPTGLLQDRIIRAFEIVPGNPAIVHHVLLNIDSTATDLSDVSGGCFTLPGNVAGVGGYAPGSNPAVFPGRAPLKIGVRIKAGSNIYLQIHYPAGTGGKVDSTQVRLFFYPVSTSGVRQVYTSTPLQNWSLNIPANTIDTFTASYGPLPIGISMYSTFPHQHLVGKSIEDYAYSGIDTIPLVRINNWEFHWQGYYTYKKLLKVPAAYTLFAKHVYDNTTANPNNPNSPPKLIQAGLNSTDEMLFDSFQYLYYQPGDDTINIAAILANDSLLVGSVTEATQRKLTSTAYPNPFNNQIAISYSLPSMTNVNISIYDIYGKKVTTLLSRQQTNGSYLVIWNGTNEAGVSMPSGVYFYSVSSGKETSNGKIVLMK